MHRHHFLLGSLALALGLAGTSAQADNNASVRILVGFAAGGSSDVIAANWPRVCNRSSASPWWWTTSPAPAARSRPSCSRPPSPTA
jgi:hypothetical protein